MIAKGPGETFWGEHALSRLVMVPRMYTFVKTHPLVFYCKLYLNKPDVLKCFVCSKCPCEVGLLLGQGLMTRGKLKHKIVRII